ncbi:MAG: hypothetical protein JOS17DRAFT_38061 [Linnemannia elongata]|nr:MAG: hypothetical protein JOS17DRAFT_38061 [Linnemannia elongata]
MQTMQTMRPWHTMQRCRFYFCFFRFLLSFLMGRGQDTVSFCQLVQSHRFFSSCFFCLPIHGPSFSRAFLYFPRLSLKFFFSLDQATIAFFLHFLSFHFLDLCAFVLQGVKEDVKKGRRKRGAGFQSLFPDTPCHFFFFSSIECQTNTYEPLNTYTNDIHSHHTIRRYHRAPKSPFSLPQFSPHHHNHHHHPVLTAFSFPLFAHFLPFFSLFSSCFLFFCFDFFSPLLLASSHPSQHIPSLLPFPPYLCFLFLVRYFFLSLFCFSLFAAPFSFLPSWFNRRAILLH